MKKSPRAGKRKLTDAEVEALEARLQEAEDFVDAIRNGQVEALVVASPAGPRVFTLEGADHRYRRLVETMNEGALLLNADGLVVYSNAAFAGLIGEKVERVVGRPLRELVRSDQLSKFDALLAVASTRSASEEVFFRDGAGTPVATLLSMGPSDDGEPGISAIVTNLAAQKRNEEILASERLARSILDQAAEAIVVCDSNGIITRASRPAQAMASGEALRQDVLSALPLRPAGDADPEHPASRALRGEVVVGVEWVLDAPDRDGICVLCTAAPLVNERNAILGCVLSLVDITRRKHAEAERAELLDAERAARGQAERARAEAEASNRTKDEFLATISHELRTPLNAIVGWSRLMTDGVVPEAQHKKGLEVIRRNADAQARLIEDLLDVSRIISGKLRIESHLIAPKAIIEAVIESVRPAADAKQIQLETIFEVEQAAVLGDESRLQQVIWNLVSNAVKFTPRNGKIQIALKSDGSTVEIVVSDSGRGIPADFLPYVFDRFRQADGGITRAHGGLGLGLAISRHLIELHGGRISVASGGPSAGSIFTLRLPAGTADRSIEINATPPPPSNRIGPMTFEPTDLSHVNVVIVEDDHDSRELLVDILKTCGARVRSTESGPVAIALLEETPADVLISDIGMPIMDGYALIRQIRGLSDKRIQKTPAVALTAYARAEDRRRALSEGFQMHLAKPVDPHELALVVASLARR